MEDREFSISHRTTYHGKSASSTNWHEPFDRRAKIVKKEVKVGDMSLTLYNLEIQAGGSGRFPIPAECHRVVGLRSGLGGSVVTIHVLDNNAGCEIALYTDIPAKE